MREGVPAGSRTTVVGFLRISVDRAATQRGAGAEERRDSNGFGGIRYLMTSHGFRRATAGAAMSGSFPVNASSFPSARPTSESPRAVR